MSQKINSLPPDINEDTYGNILSFEGETRLKSAGSVLNYTKEHLQQILKCMQDKFYFFENFAKITTIDKGVGIIKLRDYQKTALKIFDDNRFSILMFPRQSGKTTISSLEILYTALFKSNQNIYILANKEKTAKSILAKIKNIYLNLPHYIQQGVVGWSKTSIELENGSIISAHATSASAIRGETANLLYIDEVAAIPPNLWSEFYSATYPTISSAETSRIILTSTPKGMNHFYKLWSDAMSGKNNYKPFSIHYKEVPIYSGEEWIRRTIADIGERLFLQEYECSFIGSQNTLIHLNFLESMVYKEGISLPQTFQEKLSNHNHLNYLSIFEEVQPGHIYSIGVDTSKLSEDISGDAMCIQVLDITEIKFHQVASYYIPDNTSISYHDFPEITYNLAQYYNNAVVFIENNEGSGSILAELLWTDYEYPNIYFERQNVPGFRQTKRTKRLGCSNLKFFIENNKLELSDFTTISQISTFVKIKDSYKGDKGKHDDSVMALLAAIFLLQISDYNNERSRIEMFNALKNPNFSEDVELGQSFFIDPNSELDLNEVLGSNESYTYLTSKHY